MMFHNVLMTSLTPLRNLDEVHCWENRPFTTIWPEDNRPSNTVYHPKSAELKKTIKKRSKRIRTAYTTDQLGVLEKTYIRLKYIDAGKRKELAESLKISEKSIKVWFQNRRMKEKRESSESSDSSVEVTTSGISPSQSPSSISPVQDVAIFPKEEPNQFHYSQDGTDTSHYQLPNFHFCNSEYQNAASSVAANDVFCNDRDTYPTYYYPSLQDYYYGESYRYDNGISNPDSQWSAVNFDLNYFQ